MDIEILQTKKEQLEIQIEKAIQDFIKETALWPEIQIETYEITKMTGPPKPAIFNVTATVIL